MDQKVPSGKIAKPQAYSLQMIYLAICFGKT
jgi:hypothetical protein